MKWHITICLLLLAACSSPSSLPGLQSGGTSTISPTDIVSGPPHTTSDCHNHRRFMKAGKLNLPNGWVTRAKIPHNQFAAWAVWNHMKSTSITAQPLDAHGNAIDTAVVVAAQQPWPCDPRLPSCTQAPLAQPAKAIRVTLNDGPAAPPGVEVNATSCRQ